MELRPIISALTRHRIAATLIVLEIAVSCAIICNALALVQQRWQALHQSSGIDEAHLLRITLGGLATDANADARTREDLSLLRGLPGVTAASVINQLPLSQNGGTAASLAPSADQEIPTLQAWMYMGCADVLSTLGLQLVAGRNFLTEECRNYSAIGRGEIDFANLRASVLLSVSTARKLFGDADPLGRKVYSGPLPFTVIGIVAELAGVRSSDEPGYAMIAPLQMNYANDGQYVLRVTDPTRREQVLQASSAALLANDNARLLLEANTYQELREAHFSKDRDMIALLLALVALLLLVTALGIVGLASFWVQQRTKQIGIRRALGGSRTQILRYFQTENFLLASAGILLGMLGAYALNQWLMSAYELPRLPWPYLPIGAVTLWLLGQLAVLGPALRAAAVPPAVATRSI